jgi:hypothetical protein
MLELDSVKSNDKTTTTTKYIKFKIPFNFITRNLIEKNFEQ